MDMTSVVPEFMWCLVAAECLATIDCWFFSLVSDVF